MLIKSELGQLERPTTPQRGTWALSLHAPQAFILQQQTLPGDALPRGTGISSDPEHLSLCLLVHAARRRVDPAWTWGKGSGQGMLWSRPCLLEPVGFCPCGIHTELPVLAAAQIETTGAL